MAVLERGGNAFDAAVAAGFTLQVVEPHLNGPGGDLPAVFWPASRGEPVVLCAQGVAPAEATIERVRGLGHELMPGTGVLAACVPGAFGGWLLLLEQFGTWRLEDVLALAIGYAEHGYPVVAGITASSRASSRSSANGRARRSSTFRAPQPGTTFRNPQLAATWRRLLDEARGGSREEEIERARRVFYEGFVAEEIDRFSREGGGLLTGDDLRDWRATLEPPVTYDYRGLTVCKTGPWGQGPAGLQQLALLRVRRRRHERRGARPHRDRVREARLRRPRRRVRRRAARAARALLSAEYNDERRRLVGDEASSELRPGIGRLPTLRTQ